MTRQLRRGLVLSEPARDLVVVLVHPWTAEAWAVRNIDSGRLAPVRSTVLLGPRFEDVP